MILFTDSVLTAITKQIAEDLPERGGALLGPAHTNLISKFIYDEEAFVTSASYQPSHSLIEQVQISEQEDNLVFKGIVHSHPGGFDRPSHLDHQAFANQLRHNLHMGSFIAPIITMQGPADQANANEISLDKHAKLTCYSACFEFCKKRKSSFLKVCEEDVGQINIDAATNDLCQRLKEEFQTEILAEDGLLQINGLTTLARYISSDHFRLDLFYPHNFPTIAPMILFSKREGEGKKLGLAEQLSVPWVVTDFEIDALSQKLLPIIKERLKETRNEPQGRFKQTKRHNSRKSKGGARQAKRSQKETVC